MRSYSRWTRISYAAVAVSVLLLSAGDVLCAKPWLGAETPAQAERRTERNRKALVEPDFPPLSIRLPPAEDPFRDITGAEVMSYLQDIIDVTRENRPEGERYWGRIAGSRAEIATAEYVAKRFREFGLTDVQLEPVRGKEQWWPLDWGVTLLADAAYGEGTDDIVLESAFPAVQLQGEPANIEALAAELVYVGRGHALDLRGRDVNGKIAVVLGSLQPDPFFQSARGHIDGIFAAGAVGVLTVMDAPGNAQYALEDMGQDAGPAFILGGNDGRFLLAALAAAPATAPLRARLKLQTEIRPTWEGRNVLGTIRGKTDEWVVVIAHLDGYFDSANDNGGGIASIIALARHFADPARAAPRRNLLFIGTSGHHEFSDGADAVIAAHADVLDKSVVVMNVEHPASNWSYFRGPLKFKRFTLPGQLTPTTTHGPRSLNVSNSSALMVDIYRQSIDRYGLVIGSMVERSPPTGDAIAFFSAGYTVVQILDANLWYHSDEDLIDTIPAAGMERATRLYADVLRQIEQYERAELVKGR